MMSTQLVVEARVPISWTRIAAGDVRITAVAGPLVGLIGDCALPAFTALLVFIAVVVRPQLGAYIYLLVTPLILGTLRGTTVSFVRPKCLEPRTVKRTHIQRP
jgi:hypothetical protein